MPMVKMIATKPFRYSTRALAVNDVFEVRAKDARILQAVQRARPYVERDPVNIPAPSKEVVAKIADAAPDRADLLARADALGIKTDARWGAKRLAEEIEKAKASS